MLRLAPSILSFDHAALREPLDRLVEAGVERIHLDVMDGQFVPPITFGADLAASLCRSLPIPVETHLMTRTPERHFEAFREAGCSRIYFHAEATSHAHRLLQALHSMGMEAGIAINPGTPVSMIEPVLGELDALLVMTVNPGWGGQSLISSALEKVRLVRAMRAEFDIEVDGGIDPSTLPAAIASGANLFVVGSFLARSKTIQQGVEALRSACS